LVATGSVALLLILFHPLRFDLKIRSSLKGQRAEVWFVYLFRLFRIGIIATPHTQDVVLKLPLWTKLLQRNQRQKEKAEEKDSFEPHDSQEPTTTKAENNDQPESSEAPEEDEIEDSKHLPSDLHSPEPEDSEKDLNQIPDADFETKPQEAKPAKTDKKPDSAQTDSEPENDAAPTLNTEKETEKTEEIVEPVKITTDDEPLEPIDETDPFKDKTPGPEIKKTKITEDSPKDKKQSGTNFREKLRKLKRKLSYKYSQTKKWLRIASKKYKILKPVALSFYKRMKKGIRLEKPAILCRYALHEPYLTGMFQGNLSILSGMLQRFGIDFVPVPTFGVPTVYVKGKACAVLVPWRFAVALFCLFFNKVVWQQGYRLFKWYRNTKNK
jgi:hypothetical protein